MSDDIKSCLAEPRRLLHPRDKLSPQVPRAGILADDEGWNVIVRRGFGLGIFKSVDDSQAPRDKQGHFVTIGAGAGGASVMRDGIRMDAQWFECILDPLISMMNEPPWARSSLAQLALLFRPPCLT